MKVLVTGGAGYIGSKVSRKLIDNDLVEKVIILDNFSFGASSLLHMIGSKKLSILKGDVRDAELIKKLIQECSHVIHLAGVVGFPACDANPWDAESSNVTATHAIAKYCKRYNAHLVFASSGSTYGKVNGVCHEDLPIDPGSLYGDTKAKGEAFVSDVGGTILRLSTLFGLSYRNRNDLLINNFVREAVLNGLLPVFQGHARRSFVHVDDAVDAFVFFLTSKKDIGIFNVGTNKNDFTKIDIAKMISKYTGCKVMEVEYQIDPEFRDYPISYDKLESTGFEANITVIDNLEPLISYYGVLK